MRLEIALALQDYMSFANFPVEDRSMLLNSCFVVMQVSQ